MGKFEMYSLFVIGWIVCSLQERERERDFEILALRLLHGNRAHAAVNSCDEVILFNRTPEEIHTSHTLLDREGSDQEDAVQNQEKQSPSN